MSAQSSANSRSRTSSYVVLVRTCRAVTKNSQRHLPPPQDFCSVIEEERRERKDGIDLIPAPESLRWSLSSDSVWLRRLEGRSIAGSGQPCSVHIHAALYMLCAHPCCPVHALYTSMLPCTCSVHIHAALYLLCTHTCCPVHAMYTSMLPCACSVHILAAMYMLCKHPYCPVHAMYTSVLPCI